MKFKNVIQNLKFLILICNFAFCIFNFKFVCYAQDNKVDGDSTVNNSSAVEQPPDNKNVNVADGNPAVEPVIVNGDKIEYSTDTRYVTVTGNVDVTSEGVKLTCDKLTLNTQTKDAQAFGNARLDDEKGVIEGTKIIYNFQNKTGIIIDSEFRSNPYFGKAEKVNKVSEIEFIARRGYMTTCSYDNPHYRIKSRKINFFPGDKVQTKDDTVYVGKIPMLYLPQYNHSLKDPLVHVQLMPGKTKYWGAYLLTAWRYSISDDIKGRIYFDYRARLGVSEGFGLNYTTRQFGRGDYKYYYTQERDHNLIKENRNPRIFQRYFIRWRHKWDIDEQTNLVSEYYKITDSKMAIHGSTYNFLKDYFYREYEKDAQPLSYVLVHRAFDYSSMDFLMQKRTNRWYSQEERLPEVKYSLPSIQIADSPFYFENSSSFLNYNYKNSVPAPAADDTDTRRDVTYNKLDTLDRFSLPMKAAFIKLVPFASGQWVYYDKNNTYYGATSQVIFSTGSEASTKFYRIFNVKSNFLDLDINELRHIVTPTMTYTYSKTSTMPSSKARFGGGATTSTSDSVALELSNKLQTKRKSQKVDIANFKVNTNYVFKPKTGDKRGSSFSDFLFLLELQPYSWMSINTDATYKHSGIRDGGDYSRFTNVNYDVNFNLSEERSIGFGQRYQRKGGKELTFNTNWRLTPKWKFGVYERYQFANLPSYKRGLREQQYFLSRDLHCWVMEITYNVTRGEGEGIWLIFRLKAFPDLEFNFNQSYHQPKPGSQSTQ